MIMISDCVRVTHGGSAYRFCLYDNFTPRFILSREPCFHVSLFTSHFFFFDKAIPQVGVCFQGCLCLMVCVRHALSSCKSELRITGFSKTFFMLAGTHLLCMNLDDINCDCLSYACCLFRHVVIQLQFINAFPGS